MLQRTCVALLVVVSSTAYAQPYAVSVVRYNNRMNHVLGATPRPLLARPMAGATRSGTLAPLISSLGSLCSMNPASAVTAGKQYSYAEEVRRSGPKIELSSTSILMRREP